MRAWQIGLIGLLAVAAAIGLVFSYTPTPESPVPHPIAAVRVPPKPAPIKYPPPHALDPMHAQWLRLAIDVRAAFDNGLVDYPSARFRMVQGLVYLPGNKPTDFILCGQINSKNRMGAYTGWTLFAAEYTSSGEVIAHMANDDTAVPEELCRGQGRAAEQREAKNRAEDARLQSALSEDELKTESDRVMAQMHALVTMKPDPILLHVVDQFTDYSGEVAWHQR